ncbi:MAG: PAS domain S-box protein, partial [Anaerolineae bacterium]|nr:PAS domain S-box protein [Anaerolineae bacterium]
MKRLSILYLEDNDVDVALVRSNLEAEGIELDLQRVETRAEFVAALEKGKFDIILTDYSLPSFDGMSAVKLAAEMCPEVPVIMISGAIGEEIAVEILKSGATDFVLKQRMERLAPAVERALKEAKEVRARILAEEMIGDSEERLKILFESAPDGYYLSDLKGTFIDGNKAAEELLGYKKEELIGRSFLKLNLLSLRELPRAAKSLASNMLGLGTGPEEYSLIRRDGSAIPVEIRTHPVKIKGKTVVLGIARDITERKKAQEEIHKLSQFRGSVIDNANVWL